MNKTYRCAIMCVSSFLLGVGACAFWIMTFVKMPPSEMMVATWEMDVLRIAVERALDSTGGKEVYLSAKPSSDKLLRLPDQELKQALANFLSSGALYQNANTPHFRTVDGIPQDPWRSPYEAYLLRPGESFGGLLMQRTPGQTEIVIVSRGSGSILLEDDFDPP